MSSSSKQKEEEMVRQLKELEEKNSRLVNEMSSMKVYNHAMYLSVGFRVSESVSVCKSVSVFMSSDRLFIFRPTFVCCFVFNQCDRLVSCVVKNS
jgi:hypothetical protein